MISVKKMFQCFFPILGEVMLKRGCLCYFLKGTQVEKHWLKIKKNQWMK